MSFHRTIILAAGVGILFISLCQAQSKARLDLGSEVSLIGEVSRITLTLDANGEQIRSTENEITFPASLSFVEVEVGEAGQSVSAKVEAQEVTPSNESEEKKLIIKVEAPNGQWLPSGVIAVANFQISDQITEEPFIELRLANSAFVSVGREGQREPAAGRAGTLTVMKEAPPIAACFFYMH